MSQLTTRASALLLGRGFTHVEYGDWWQLRTDGDVWLNAQDLRVSTEAEITAALRAALPGVLDTVDPGIAPCAAALFSVLRRPVEEVTLDDDGRLGLRIGTVWVQVGVDADIVDWQWSLSRQPGMPYVAPSEIACFFRGDVRGREPSE